MTGYRDMDKKHQKCPRNGGFPIFETPQDLKKIKLCHFCNLMEPQLHAKNGQSLRNLKTDGRTDGWTTDGQS